MERYWHCFHVSDYGGGELYSNINLSITDLLDILTNESWDFLSTYTDEDLRKLLKERVVKELYAVFALFYEISDRQNGEYAGYSGFTTPEVYYTTEDDGVMTQGFPTESEIADYVYNSITEYLACNE